MPLRSISGLRLAAPDGGRQGHARGHEVPDGGIERDHRTARVVVPTSVTRPPTTSTSSPPIQPRPRPSLPGVGVADEEQPIGRLEPG